MAVTTKKSLLFLAGGVAAAAVVAYAAGAFDPLLTRAPETIAALPEAGQKAGTDSKNARLPGTDEPAAAPGTPAASSTPEAPASAAAPEPASPQPETPATSGPTEAAVVPPSFDVVRVEGGGSIVIAGKAAANAKVDLLVGSNVIGSATAGPAGDFAVVLDDPLEPGDYQIVLRATAPDNVVAMSVETAVVAVPETEDGQVLALVEEPGKPSQMITLPKPQAPAAAVSPPAVPDAPAAEAPGPGEQKPAGEKQEAAAPAETAPASSPATQLPTGPAVRVEAVEIDGRKIFVAGIADPDRTVRGYANEILLGDARASPDGRFLIEADRDLPVGDYIIRVDALEPDGVKVAARAAVPFAREPGETIAAVAPPAPEAGTPPVAETPAASAPAGEAPIAAAPAPGTDTGGGAPATAMPPASAEAPAADGADTGAPTTGTPPATVQAPAEAPAAGSGQIPTSQETQSAEAPAAAGPTGQPSDSRATQPAAEASATEPPAAETPATGTQPRVAAQAPATAQPEAPAATPKAPAAETPATPAPDAPAATAEAPVSETPAIGGTPSAEAPSVTEEAPPVAAEPDIASAPQQESELPAPPPAEGVTEVLAPKLESVASAVIIRRGDTLWRISRRVYGRGVRYSTIYLANQDQIEDPDRIWPGQVFEVPEKSIDGNAEADYSTLGESLTTVPKESAE